MTISRVPLQWYSRRQKTGWINTLEAVDNTHQGLLVLGLDGLRYFPHGEDRRG